MTRKYDPQTLIEGSRAGGLHDPLQQALSVPTPLQSRTHYIHDAATLAVLASYRLDALLTLLQTRGIISQADVTDLNRAAAARLTDAVGGRH